MNEIAILLLAIGLLIAFVQGMERRHPDRDGEREELRRMVVKRRRENL